MEAQENDAEDGDAAFDPAWEARMSSESPDVGRLCQAVGVVATLELRLRFSGTLAAPVLHVQSVFGAADAARR